MARKSLNEQNERLFEEKLVPAKPGSDGLFEVSYDTEKPIKCLGLEFANDEARRTYFLEKLQENLKDPEFRKIEGFPIGDEEHILALSDPPYFTACPNPFLGDFVGFGGKRFNINTDDYYRKPFAADVSEGKNDPIYNAHSYHTKVPHKAIMRYILHYTEPGDIVFDGFCGTGMTGLAAQLCADSALLESLGYTIKKGGTIVDPNGVPFSKVGQRYCILADLSPAASFIGHNYNTPLNISRFSDESAQIIESVSSSSGWMCQTQDPKTNHLYPVTYTIWSDVFSEVLPILRTENRPS